MEGSNFERKWNFVLKNKQTKTVALWVASPPFSVFVINIQFLFIFTSLCWGWGDGKIRTDVRKMEFLLLKCFLFWGFIFVEFFCCVFFLLCFFFFLSFFVVFLSFFVVF